MAKNNNTSLFRKLTRLFRSGPVVKRKIATQNSRVTSSAFETFRKNQSTVYSSAMSAYGTYDRMARYSDFSEMEYTPEIGSALDIYAEESVSSDENGKSLHIFSDNSKIKKILEELFFDTLNIEFNMTSWVRNLCKYGDFFLFNDVDPSMGVINVFPLPISEVEREEGFDPNDPMAVRFRWVTQGNQVLENWQISHMRLLGNDAFLPYGSSVLESARRIWRQLILIEDAMLVYRIVRAPERRVFKIDVGNVPPEDIPGYMEKAQSSLKRAQITDKSTGRVDLRYNPLSVDEDYFIPVRGSESGTDITSLAGGTMAGETNDVEYIQKKLFAALKIPKAYLGYDEGLGAKATLSQEDIRFSRTIARIQRTILAELNKVAIIHLYCNGFTDEDLLDFSLKLSNPSTIAQQQKLELFRSRFEIAGSALGTPGLVDRYWVQKNILKLSDEEIAAIKSGAKNDKRQDLEVESTQITEPEGPESPVAGDPSLAGGLNLEPPQSNLPPLPGQTAGQPTLNLSELSSIDDDDMPIKIHEKINNIVSSLEDDKEANDEDLSSLEKFQKDYKKNKKIKDSKKSNSPYREAGGNVWSINGPQQRRQRAKPEGDIGSELKSLGEIPILKEEDFDINEYLDNKIMQNAHMTGQIKSTLNRFDKKFGPKKKTLMSENNSSEEKND
jgi:hypothetical protein